MKRKRHAVYDNDFHYKIKFGLILQSLVPLPCFILIKMLFLYIQNQDIGAFIILFSSLIWIIFAIASYIKLIDFSKIGPRDDNDQIKIEEELTDSNITFFMAIVVPLLFDDITEWNGGILFLSILAFLILLLWKTNLFYQNPILIVFGYKIYKANLIKETGQQHIEITCIAISKGALDEDKNVKYKLITENIYFIQNKKK